jgi:hypothetical protein
MENLLQDSSSVAQRRSGGGLAVRQGGKAADRQRTGLRGPMRRRPMRKTIDTK